MVDGAREQEVVDVHKLSEWAPGCPFFGLVPCGEER
jgi:hypothetical protein